MYKKSIKAFANVIFLSLVLTITLSTTQVKAASGSVTQIGGATRYETAAKVAIKNWTRSDFLVLVSGEGYADAISGAILAKKLDSPIMFTNSKTLDINSKNVLKTLKVKDVYVIGGTSSISHSIEEELKLDYNVIRLGGDTRYDTNLAVAKYLEHNLGVRDNKIIAVAGTGFSDALSAAAITNKDEILLLTNNNKNLMKNAIDFTKDSNVTVIGTTNTVSDSIYNALNGDKRIEGGLDRFATNLNVLKAFDKDLKNNKLYIANATENNYADPLLASVVAGKYSAPLVLTDIEGSTATNNAVNYIGTKATKDTDIQAIGGTKVITKNIITKINNTISGDKTVVTFKDKNLEQGIRLTINKPEGILYKSDVDKIINGYFYFNKIKDISGIEKLTNVQMLGLGDNEIRDISPVRNLINLRHISFSGNKIKDISPLKNLTNLQMLELGDNEIKDISPLKNLTNLQNLVLYRNEITDISSLKNLTKLQNLDLSRNEVKDISSLKNLTKLQSLNLSRNKIKDISPLKNLTNLQELILSEGQLSDDDIDSLKSNLPNLKIRFE